MKINELSDLYETTDLSKEFDVLLSEKAKKALEVKADKQTFKDEHDSYSLLSITAMSRITLNRNGFEEKDLEKAIQAVADDLNKLADAGLIHSCLSKPGKLVLTIKDLSLPSAIYCFVLIPDSRRSEALALVNNANEYDGLLGTNYN